MRVRKACQFVAVANERGERENGVAARVRCVAAAEGAGRAKERQNTGWYTVIVSTRRARPAALCARACANADARRGGTRH